MKNYSVRVTYDVVYEELAETYEEAKLKVGHLFLDDCSSGVSYADLKFDLIDCEDAGEVDDN